MRSVFHLAASRLALGLVLGLGGLAAVATPALAAKKEEAPKANYSKPFQAAAQAAQKANTAKDWPALIAALPATDAAASTPSDKYLAANFRLNAGIGTNDKAMQRQGIEAMLTSGGAPAAEVPKFEFFAGQFALDAKDYDPATAHLGKAVELGYPGSAAPLMAAEAYFQKAISLSSNANGQLAPAAKPVALQGLPYLKKAIESEKATGAAVPAAWYNRGFTMAYVAGSPDAAEWQTMNLNADPSGKNWNTLIRAYQDTHKTLSKGENLDLLRLARLTGGMDSAYQYSEYVDATSKVGLLGEVKGAIDEGRASGKLKATDLADYYAQASAGIAKDKASLPATETAAAKAATGKIASNTADAYVGYGDYAKAVPLYKLALQKGGVDANEVNTRLGIALARSGDKAGAKAAFESVTTPGARKDIAGFWLLWLSKQA